MKLAANPENMLAACVYKVGSSCPPRPAEKPPCRVDWQGLATRNSSSCLQID